MKGYNQTLGFFFKVCNPYLGEHCCCNSISPQLWTCSPHSVDWLPVQLTVTATFIRGNVPKGSCIRHWWCPQDDQDPDKCQDLLKVGHILLFLHCWTLDCQLLAAKRLCRLDRKIKVEMLWRGWG
jgi:hypothetical protein